MPQWRQPVVILFVCEYATCGSLARVCLLETASACSAVIAGHLTAFWLTEYVITLPIVCHYIQGNGRQPISWGTFIDTARRAGFVALANIREGLK